MKVTVVWTQEAMNQLAQAWLNAADRAAVTSSADAIDAQLRQSPETAGVPYDDNTLILIIPALGGSLSVPSDGQSGDRSRLARPPCDASAR